jgi:hypothetical protein
VVTALPASVTDIVGSIVSVAASDAGAGVF